MKHLRKFISILLLTVFLPLVAATPGKSGEKIGLVLSGGGAKGVAHVGVIKALEDNDIPIDYVSGTSMGAIVGSLYACGWSPERMMEFFFAPDFLDWANGNINRNKIYYYSQPAPTPKWTGFNFSFSKGQKESITKQLMPSSIVSPIPMNIEFLKLYGPYTEQCGSNFDNLFVPFRCVASDVYHKHKLVLDSGSLGESVRASMSIPVVYRPIEIDSVYVYDGGIYDNFPVDVMEEDFHPDFIIGVSVVGGGEVKPSSGDVYSQIEDLVIQHQDYNMPDSLGVKIQVPLQHYGMLQFDKVKAIYDIGYQAGLEMVDSIKSRVHARRPISEVIARRAEFADKTPVLEFDSVAVTGLGHYGTSYLEYLFDRGGNTPFGIKQTENAYYRAVTEGTLTNLLPTADFRKDGKNILNLEASPKRAWNVGIGGWLTTSTNSMLYLTTGHHTMSLNALDLSLSGWLGQSYLAGELAFKFGIRSKIPSYFGFEAVASRQKYYDSDVLFYQTKAPTFITESEYFLRTRYVWAVGRTTRGYAHLTAGYIDDSYFPGSDLNFTDQKRDVTEYLVGALNVGFDHSTLNNQMYPNQGVFWKVDAMASYQFAKYKPEGESIPGNKFTAHPSARVTAQWKRFIKASNNVSLGVMGEGVGTLGHIYQNYTATVLHAPGFAPTPATKNYFNAAFRSENYLAAGFIPVWIPFTRLQLRGDFYAFVPVRNLQDRGADIPCYNGWFRTAEFIGEVAAVLNFPFASLSVYGNYLSEPAHNWNFGVSFGLYFQAPKLL
jgi:NTE family protein